MRFLLGAALALLSTAASAQTTIVTVNGRAFEMPAGTTATFVTDGQGTRMVAAVATMPPTAPMPIPAEYVGTSHPGPAPRLDYADLAPESETIGGEARILRIRRDRESGHFIAPVVINGVRVRAILDTGASSTVLSPEDAVATGADRDVRYTRPGVGIGGYTTLYVTKVRDLEIGGQHLGSFSADIGQQGIPHTLLGQTEIAKLTRRGRIVIQNDVMTIYPGGVEVASR